ncbi:ATP-dependent DNA helicase MER3 [Boothiomyces sp. JEL0866]|nr:ATP-dependent DNA helicase MER3 [Boothiomyces sp. JEL0866]
MDDFNHLDGIGSQELLDLFADIDSIPNSNSHTILRNQTGPYASAQSNQLSLNTNQSKTRMNCNTNNANSTLNSNTKGASNTRLNSDTRNKKPDILEKNCRLLKTSTIPQGSFFNFDYFNEIQTKSFEIVYNTNSNFLLVAPTGSGKTVIFELAILSLVQHTKSPKIVYIAPTKALCQERFEDWQSRFKLKVSLITGDITGSTNYNLLITTPEKFDSITRNGKNIYQLVLVDEIHFIKDSSRGSCLEVLLTNLKTRIVAVSATISNINDIANWLNAKMLYFGQEYRPVQLEKHVYGFQVSQSLFAFEDGLKYKLLALISTFWKGKPVLVFCCTRKSVVSTAEYVSEQTSMFNSCASEGINDKKLGALLRKGLCYNDRKIVEQLFFKGRLLCLFTTSTLALGVNLPAHLVIIKGTLQYNFNTGKLEEYSDLDLLQMIGRAGRPQFDKTGTVLILTTSNRKKYIQDIVDESINNFDTAMEWLKSTFLYLRIQKNPGYYQFKKIDKQDGMKSAEYRLESIYNNELNKLVQAGLVKTNPDRSVMSVTKYGDIMSRYYLKFQTIVNFMKLTDYKQSQVFSCLCKAQEFDEIRFRSDKMILNQINKLSGIKYPIKGKVIDLWQKVSLCLQVSIGNVSLSEIKSGTIQSDITNILTIAKRLFRGMKNVLIERGSAEGIISACKLSQAINCQIWPTGTILKQVEGTKILSAVNKIPKPFITVTATACIDIKVGLENSGVTLKMVKSQLISFNLVIYTTTKVIKHVNLSIENLVAGYSINVKSDNLTVDLICNEFVGIDITKSFSKPERSKFFRQESVEFDGDDIWDDVNVVDLITMDPDVNECHHRCLDKSKCLHKCCKCGISQKTLKKRQASRELENLIDIEMEDMSGLPQLKKICVSTKPASSYSKITKNKSSPPSFSPKTTNNIRNTNDNQEKDFRRKTKREIATFDCYIDEDIDMTLVELDQPAVDTENTQLHSLESELYVPFQFDDYIDLYDIDLPQLELSEKVKETYNALHGINTMPRSVSTDAATIPLLPSKEISLQNLKADWNTQTDELDDDDNVDAILNLF